MEKKISDLKAKSQKELNEKVKKLLLKQHEEMIKKLKLPFGKK